MMENIYILGQTNRLRVVPLGGDQIQNPESESNFFKISTERPRFKHRNKNSTAKVLYVPSATI